MAGLDRPGPTGVPSTTRGLGVQACVPLLDSIRRSVGPGQALLDPIPTPHTGTRPTPVNALSDEGATILPARVGAG